MSQVLFGPSGNSQSFYDDGFSSTLDAAKWVKDKGLELFEYSFGQGYRMTGAMAEKLGQEFQKQGVELSIHAPYFINFSNPDPDMFEKSIGYIKTGIKFMHYFGAKRLVFHAASCGKETRENAVKLLTERMKECISDFESELDEKMYLCPETMGKVMQIGTYREIIDLCTLSKSLMPTFDFGHINALTQGTLKTKDDYKRIFDYSFEKLGEERTKNAHIHFSKIQYGAKGEIKHLTFDDQIFGPNFEPLCDYLVENNMNCHILCESAGTQAEDALKMQQIYKQHL